MTSRSAIAARPARIAWLLLAALAAGCSEEETITAQPELEIAAREIDFGDVPVLNARSQALELKNVGRAPLVIDSVELDPAGGAFTLEAAPESIEAGVAAPVRIGFLPTAFESYRATLRIRSEDEANPLVEVELTGRGQTAGRIELPAGLEFPGICEGSEELRRIKVASTGTSDLVIEEIELAEGTSPELQILSSTRTPVTVPMGSELLITVRYRPGPGAPDVSEGAVAIRSADPDKREAQVPLRGTVDRVPVAAIAEVAPAAPGAIVSLDGSASSDPDSDLPLVYAWSLKSSPIGSTARPTPADAALSQLTLDLPGEYLAQLEVEDAHGCRSQPALAAVVARPAEKLLVELVWDNHDADLDLHLAPEGEAFFGPLDCYYASGHMRPDWGTTGDPADDPSLDRDALTGFGPELVSYRDPAAGRYVAMVHYYSDHRSAQPATTATLRVYVFGVLESETRRVLESEGREWTVLSIDWPGGSITPIDRLEWGFLP